MKYTIPLIAIGLVTSSVVSTAPIPLDGRRGGSLTSDAVDASHAQQLLQHGGNAAKTGDYSGLARRGTPWGWIFGLGTLAGLVTYKMGSDFVSAKGNAALYRVSSNMQQKAGSTIQQANQMIPSVMEKGGMTRAQAVEYMKSNQLPSQLGGYS